jgi:small subunit ribosomal protein S20
MEAIQKQKRKIRKHERRKILKPKRSQLNQKRALKNKEQQEKRRGYRTLSKNHLKEIEKEYSRQSSLQKDKIDLTNLKTMLSQFQKILDKSAQKRVIHKNNAARKKSKISRKINDLEKQTIFNNSV